MSFCQEPRIRRSIRQSQNLHGAALRGRSRVRRTYHQTLCHSEIPEQRAVLLANRSSDDLAVGTRFQTRTQIVLALVVGGEVAAEQRRFFFVMDARAARQRAN